MANLNRMEGLKFKYFNHSTNLKHAVRRNQDKENLMPEQYAKGSTESITVPGMAITIKELMKRYETGKPLPRE